MNVKRGIALLLLAAFEAMAQAPAVDRMPSEPLSVQAIERPGGGFFGDFFRLGAAGETWMIDRIRLWFVSAEGGACGKELGDSIEKITLLGALDNPPKPGEPACDCHALTALSTAPFAAGSSETRNPNVTIAKEGGAYRIDFQNLRWSVPSASDVLFSLRAKARAKSSCAVEKEWSLAATQGTVKLHVQDAKGVPAGLADQEARPIAIQVWAKRRQ